MGLMFKRSKYILLTLIFMIAFVGRVIHIADESLLVDEGFSYWTLRQPDITRAWEIIINDVHPPIYFFTLRAWAAFTGLSEFALRYFSVIPSLLSVAVVYQIANELEQLRQAPNRHRGDLASRTYSESVIPILAALMMALADMEGYIGQQMRQYTWHVLWAALSMWAFLRWIRTNRRGYLLDWGAVSLLLLYTHYIGICTLAAQGLYTLLFLRGRRLAEALIGFAIVGAAFVPWLLIVVSGQIANIGTGYNVPSTLASLWNWCDQWFTQQWALLIGLALIGLFTFQSKKLNHQDTKSAKKREGQHSELKTHRSSLLLLAWLVVPITLTYLLNLRVPILMDYRLTQITPAVALLIAFGLGHFRGMTLGFLVAVIVVYGVAVDDLQADRARPDFREIAKTTAEYAEPGDLALAHITPSGDWQMVYHFDRLLPDGVDVRSLRQWQLEEGDTYAAGLPALLNQHPHVWFMHWSKDMSGFDALAQTGHVQTAHITYDWLGSALDLFRYDMLPPSEEAPATFENGMTLRDAIIYPDQMHVDLWWQIAGSTTNDYTVSAILLDQSGRLVGQIDSYPFDGARPTSTWSPDEVIYDSRSMRLAKGITTLAPGIYTVGVKIYLLNADNTFTDILSSDGQNYATIGTLER